MGAHTPQRVLVTGGTGFVGHHLVERLRDRGDEVTVFDAVAPRGAALSGVRFVEGDLRDGAALARAARGAEVIHHLAAVVGVDQYLARPLDVIDINFSGTRNVLDVAVRAGAKVVLASTSEVFGKNPAVPWPEDGDRVLGPTASDRWSYASSKALAEHLTFAFVRQHGLAATIVRYFNVYGPRQRPAYVVSRSVHRALNGRPLVVYDGGRQTRCFTFVDDAVAGTLRAADEPAAAGEAFNIGSMVETAVGTVVGLVAELTGTTSVVDVDTATALGASYEDLGRRVPDNAKAGRILGWRPRTSLRDGLVKTIEWARADDRWLALPDSGAA
ncbi:NAD-dependent epimerase/dehydratase family protein [Streptomyces sp. NBC_00249]|uniref:NAD-dependent epimerase/dehydratase family protein n=1 Tax=Streptomyces sp. NBC_00249 TaxID=2975690 RepID=UPI0022522F0B|nr:NAD-dependent epimerase/dehydratase family protein [Streptomyces sp. NBC_00249]MCX5199512.1 NAD-dependent epimerase/dehydratase family protein [Streptomyces sp. NBC_00249]